MVSKDGLKLEEIKKSALDKVVNDVKIRQHESDLFDKMWLTAAEEGYCDGFGGAEYMRVKGEWMQSGQQKPILQFIKDAANRTSSVGKENIEALLSEYDDIFMSEDHREKVLLTIDWKNGFPRDAGVYVFFRAGEIVYVGETGSLQGRMNDMRNTLNHTLRRNVGAIEFRNEPGFEKATSRKKFPPHIEEMVGEYLSNLQVKAVPIHFGRKEIEEFLIDKYEPIYNRKTKRG